MGKIKEILVKSGLYILVAVVVLGFVLLSIRTHTLEIVDVNRIIYGGSVDAHEYIRAEIIPDKEVSFIAPKQLNVVKLKTHEYQPLNKTIEACQFDQPVTKNDYLRDLELQKEQYAFELLQQEQALEKMRLNYSLKVKEATSLNDLVKQKEALYLQGAYSKVNLDSLKNDQDIMNYQLRMAEMDLTSKEKSVELMTKSTELKLEELASDERALETKDLIITDDQGRFFAEDNYFITYMNEESVIHKGEVLMKYIPNNPVEDVYVRVYSNEPGGFSPALETSVRLDIIKSDRFIEGQVFKVLHYKDYNEIKIRTERTWQPSSLMNISLSGDIVVFHETPLRIDKSAILPVDGFKKGNQAFIYLLEERKTIFGTEHVVKKCEVTMTHVGSSMVGFTSSGNRYLQSVLRNEERVYVVNYPNGLLKDGQHVRLAED